MVGKGGEGVGLGLVIYFSFFQKNPKLKKRCFLFEGGEGKRGLASVSEFV